MTDKMANIFKIVSCASSEGKKWSTLQKEKKIVWWSKKTVGILSET
jgi:hypothetical protein